MTIVRCAAVQMTSGVDVDENLRAVAGHIEAAAAKGAQFIVLPENFSAMGRKEADRCALAESDGDGPLQNFLAEQAARYAIWIVGGTIPVAGDDPVRPTASSLVFAADGRRVARYDKIHLFDVGIPGQDERYCESAHTRAGSLPMIVTTPWGGLCVAVCYDVRFPELFRSFSATELKLIALPAAFTATTGAAHWATLLRARAIENLCFVVAAAQTGRHENGRQTYGHSMLISPWGKVIADAGTDTGVIVADLDLEAQADMRRRFPVLEHRSQARKI
ncbi:MAG: carbon-nitrogen hydrolase family protein [Gammaproteobacteria bacterium]|jgi:nitrilase|nr:acyltransferase [Chromatiales bacterium]MDP6674174.1 carbon-nitrogen hydrolase family protein [Gammaproteobacteria bacterium]